jgi:hypothetical protein
MTQLSGVPHKRKRRSKQELQTLDAHLIVLVQQNQPCTIRQIYYRAVVAGLCDKTESGYDLVQRRLLKLRRENFIPYGWIKDNLRSHYGSQRFTSLEEFGLHASKYLYSYDYWHENPVSVQVWCESDSIAGTLVDTVCNTYGLRLYVARGFSSETYLYEAAEEIKADGRETFIYLFSDFDPSGISLAETIQTKLEEFVSNVPIRVKRLALSREQVVDWNLPTHDLKKSDTRAKRFAKDYADFACELEAIPSTTLRQLVSNAISQHINPRRLEAAKEDEMMQREALAGLPEWFRGL